MDNRFDDWNSQQKLINARLNRPFFHERDIWLCAGGYNIGTELYGKGSEFIRPIIVLKKFNNKSFLGLPLTSKIKNRNYRFLLKSLPVRKSAVVLSQVRHMDALRLKRKIGVVNKEEFDEIKNSLREIIS